MYCIKLRKEVLDEPAFAQWAGEEFVLLEVDVPQNPKFDRALREKNVKLCDKYGVSGYPTVLVLDDRGRALGGLFGYIGNPQTVRKILEKGVMAVQLLKEAEGLQGEEKAAKLIEAWQLVPPELHDLNAELKAEIIELDVSDKSGLKAAAAAERAFERCVEEAENAPTDAAALAIVEAALSTAVEKYRRRLMELRYYLLLSSVETEADVHAVAALAYELNDTDDRLTAPAKERRKNKLRAVFENPQALIERNRNVKRKRPIR